MQVISGRAAIFLLHAEFTSGDPEIYQLPLALESGEAGKQAAAKYPEFAIAQVQAGSNASGFLYDATADPAFCSSLVEAFAKRKRLRGEAGVLAAQRDQLFRNIWAGTHPNLDRTRCAPNSILRSDSENDSSSNCCVTRAWAPLRC